MLFLYMNTLKAHLNIKAFNTKIYSINKYNIVDIGLEILQHYCPDCVHEMYSMALLDTPMQEIIILLEVCVILNGGKKIRQRPNHLLNNTAQLRRT